MTRLAALFALALAMLVAAPRAVAQAGLDCTGPAGDPAPGTAAWDEREDENVYCATQRNLDTASNPAYQHALLQPAYLQWGTLLDPFRVPTLWAGSRFRFERVSFANAAGKKFPALLFRPLKSARPPYPGVVITHGGLAHGELYLWAAEGLAEAGYMVLTFDIPRTDQTHYEDTKTALDYFMSNRNPHLAELDRRHIGLAGHSAGGVAVSRLGQEDRRVSALVSWDRAQSSPMPAGLKLRTPALFEVADFNCQKTPVCLPVRYSTPTDPRGPGNKDQDFQRLRAAGVDTMKIALRAATHLNFVEFPQANGSRYGAVTAFYYTLAWFDRYLRGRADGLRRLVATRFDNSADEHNISGGQYDPTTGANLPPRVDGQPVADRLSFHWRSACFLEGGAYRSEDMRRSGCRLVRAVALRLLVRPRTARVGIATRFRFHVTTRAGGDVSGAVVAFAGDTARTDSHGRATMTERFRTAGIRSARASKAGFGSATARVQVLPARSCAGQRGAAGGHAGGGGGGGCRGG